MNNICFIISSPQSIQPPRPKPWARNSSEMHAEKKTLTFSQSRWLLIRCMGLETVYSYPLFSRPQAMGLSESLGQAITESHFATSITTAMA